MTDYPLPDENILDAFRSGRVIPAHPLALTKNGRLDEPSQRALSRYYLEAGAGGMAVGVHTTQFEIRDPKHGLLQPVLELAAETARSFGAPDTILIAGVCGQTSQAVSEAKMARDIGYHAGLLSLAALGNSSEDEMLAHAERVAREIAIVGFYLQPAVGGRRLDYSFWRRFSEIPGVIGIKVAPFNRYQTQDVLRAIADSPRRRDITLYTGNDDHIILDLASTWSFGNVEIRFSGGLLGHWACWTQPAIEQLARCKKAAATGTIDRELQILSGQVTEANAALFDVANGFAGCIAGIHHVLHSQGLMGNARCLDPAECMSAGQAELIEAIRSQYPHLVDDDFVRENIRNWR